MVNAMKAVQSGEMGVNKAALEYGILKTTLLDRISGGSKGEAKTREDKKKARETEKERKAEEKKRRKEEQEKDRNKKSSLFGSQMIPNWSLPKMEYKAMKLTVMSVPYASDCTKTTFHLLVSLRKIGYSAPTMHAKSGCMPSA